MFSRSTPFSTIFLTLRYSKLRTSRIVITLIVPIVTLAQPGFIHTMDKINTSNLLSHNEKEEAPCKNGYSFRYQGIIDKNIEQLRLLNKYNYPPSDVEATYTEVLKRGPHYNFFGNTLIFMDLIIDFRCVQRYRGWGSMFQTRRKRYKA
jgi:hypothetical protein